MMVMILMMMLMILRRSVKQGLAKGQDVGWHRAGTFQSDGAEAGLLPLARPTEAAALRRGRVLQRLPPLKKESLSSVAHSRDARGRVLRRRVLRAAVAATGGVP